MPDAMKHPTPQDLAAFSQGKLSQDTAEAVARHLQACPECQAAAQRGADSFLGKVQDARPAPSGTRLPPGPKRAEAPSLIGSTTHPSAQALALFGHGKLPAAQAATVAAHLEACAACRQAVAALPADSFTGKVRAAGSGSSSLPPSRPGATGLPGPATSAAAPGNVPPELAGHAKYRVVRELGRGGMGVVYQAVQTLMDRTVALKVMNPDVLAHPDALPRFHAEVKAAAKLDHPNIVRAFDAEQVGALHLLVMEFVEGHSLAQLVEREGPQAVARACHSMHQALLGLQHAFEQGMAHRDVKPQNLMLTPKGQVKVLDFGLARLRQEAGNAKRLTRLGDFMGTPEYVAPEQASDASKADTRSDIYSLGCTLFFLLTGRPPFVEDTAVKLVLAHIEKEPPPLHELRADVPADLSAVVGRMLAKDPTQRYQSPIEAARALAPFCKAGAKSGPQPVVAPAQPGVSAPGRGTVLPGDTNRGQALGKGASRLPAPRKAATAAGSPFQDLGGDEAPPARRSKTGRQPGRAKAGRRPWMLASIGAAVVALGLGAWLLAGVVFKVKVKTEDGEAFVVLEIDQPGAEVLVDGEKIQVTIPGDSKLIEIRVPPGKHTLEVKKGGFLAYTRDVELAAGKGPPIRVRLEPMRVAVAPPQERSNDRPAPTFKPPEQPKEPVPPLGKPRKEPTDPAFSADVVEKRERPEVLDCTLPNGVSAAEMRRAQEAWAKYLGRKVEETVEVVDGVKMTFVLVPPGKFRMGSPSEEQDYITKTFFDGKRPDWLDDERQHEVTLTEPFYLGKTEVTHAQYKALGLENPSQFKGDDLPVEMVSWTEAKDWAEKLTKKRKDGH
jgi:anti-sigma factor ChrR (cupin superfamily)/predicted Ser/Thr protein kinase